MNNIFIPKRICVGYRKREDTFSKQLAYIIYYDLHGNLRKKSSWDTWRDHTIDSQEFDNNPQDNFIINKNVERHNWSHFSSGRSYIRVYDSRGIEFEITPENLIGILMHTDCSKRQLDGQFVYAWSSGGKLILLPTTSEEYQNALKFTKRQGQAVAAKSLIPGCSYKTKQGTDVLYLGYFLWYHWNVNKGRKGTKKHIFMVDNYFVPKSDMSFLAQCNSGTPVPDYADKLEKFKDDIHSSKIVKWELSPVPVSFEYGSENSWNCYLKRSYYYQLSNDQLTCYNLLAHKSATTRVEYSLEKNWIINIHSGVYSVFNTTSSYHWSLYHKRHSQEDVIQYLAGTGDVDMVLENGKRIKVGYWLGD